MNEFKYNTNSNIKIQKRNNIFSYIHVKFSQTEKLLKISEKDFKIPELNEYNLILKFNYTIPMFKKICEKYNISKTGNKQELSKNIYSFLYATNSIVKIQRRFKRFLRYKLNKLHGPGFENKNVCVNDTDFLTMESLNDIPDHKFYSFIDDDKIIYGFHISSLIKAINKDINFRNPYNRKPLPISKMKTDINLIIKLNKMFNITSKKNVEPNKNNEYTLSISKQIDLKILAFCQKMDELGNYTDVSWFTSLDRQQIIKFIRELYDIWCYRAQLTEQTKKEICPNCDPCQALSIYEISVISIEELKIKMIKIIDNLIYKGINRDSQFLGASFVLSALTLVNENAAQSMPWLYYSVAHVQ
jgi:hypothetical protein